MNILFAAVINFVFVFHVLGQGDYVGRSQDTVVKKPLELMPKPFDINQGPNMGPITGPFNSGMGNLQGGGLGIEPEFIKNIIGSTILNKQILGGQDGFPRHGGTLNPDGLVNGWGADPNVPIISEVAAWQDPLNGFAFPVDYTGQDLYFDQSLNRYAIQNSGLAAVNTGGLAPVGGPIGLATAQAEHNIVKDANHVAQNKINGMGPFDGVGGVNTGYIKAGSLGPRIVDQIGHGIAKSTDGIPRGSTGNIQHDIAKASTGIHPGLPGAGSMYAGHDVIGHNIVKSVGGPAGLGFNPSGVIGEIIGVDHIGKNPFPGNMNPLLGAVGSGGVIHNVNKVGMTGVASIGNDPMAASLGQDLALQAAGKASAIVDMGSHGGMSMGDPFANAAAHGLAKEAVHVAGETLSIASAGTVHVGSVIGSVPMVKPPTGYGRRI